MPIITRQEEIAKVIDYLTHYNGKDYILDGACKNVGFALQNALDKFTPDDDHEYLTFTIDKLPNQLDIAERECCTTDCYAYQKGICPHRNKYHCHTIKECIEKHFGSPEDFDNYEEEYYD